MTDLWYMALIYSVSLIYDLIYALDLIYIKYLVLLTYWLPLLFSSVETCYNLVGPYFNNLFVCVSWKGSKFSHQLPITGRWKMWMEFMSFQIRMEVGNNSNNNDNNISICGSLQVERGLVEMKGVNFCPTAVEGFFFSECFCRAPMSKCCCICELVFIDYSQTFYWLSTHC